MDIGAFLVLSIIFNIMCSIVCLIMAKSRQLKRGDAFMIGIFLGPFGILIVAFMPEPTKVDAMSALVSAAAATAQAAAIQVAATADLLQVADSVECPRCAETIKRKAKVCRFCGYEPPGGSFEAVSTALRR